MPITGLATYYDAPQGALTASGEPFDRSALTAACLRVPRGTTVKVQLDRDPNMSVTVRVNDAGPFAHAWDGQAMRPLTPDPDRIIDLTPAAFVRLAGNLNLGKVPVTLTVIS